MEGRNCCRLVLIGLTNVRMCQSPQTVNRRGGRAAAAGPGQNVSRRADGPVSADLNSSYVCEKMLKILIDQTVSHVGKAKKNFFSHRNEPDSTIGQTNSNAGADGRPAEAKGGTAAFSLPAQALAISGKLIYPDVSGQSLPGTCGMQESARPRPMAGQPPRAALRLSRAT